MLNADELFELARKYSYTLSLYNKRFCIEFDCNNKPKLLKGNRTYIFNGIFLSSLCDNCYMKRKDTLNLTPLTDQELFLLKVWRYIN